MTGRSPYRRPVVVSVRRPPTEADLVRACVAGDRAAWADLHRRYHRLVAKQCSGRAARLGLSQADADDALQAFWADFPRTVKAWRPGPATLATWLTWRSLHAVDRLLQHRGRAVSGEVFERARREPSTPEAEVSGAELSARVRAAALPTARTDREREVLEERLLADPPSPVADLARSWGVSRQRVDQLQQRLLTRLAVALLPLAA